MRGTDCVVIVLVASYIAFVTADDSHKMMQPRLDSSACGAVAVTVAPNDIRVGQTHHHANISNPVLRLVHSSPC